MIIDLFSGSGSATGIWETKGYDVWRYDLVAPEKPDTFAVDLSDKKQCQQIVKDYLKHYQFESNPFLIWASPPCTEYSTANRSRNELWKEGILPDLTLWQNAMYIIATLEPTYWVIENVAGAQRVHGPSRQNFGAYHLWGNFPKFNISEPIPKKGIHSKDGAWKPGDTKSSRAAEAAQVPYAISWGLFRAITLQKVLFPPD